MTNITEAKKQTIETKRAIASALLPLSRRGLCREEAAAYICVSVDLFDKMRKDGRMPQPKRINGRLVWDVRKLDIAFEALPGDDTVENPWDA